MRDEHVYNIIMCSNKQTTIHEYIRQALCITSKVFTHRKMTISHTLLLFNYCMIMYNLVSLFMSLTLDTIYYHYVKYINILYTHVIIIFIQYPLFGKKKFTPKAV